MNKFTQTLKIVTAILLLASAVGCEKTSGQNSQHLAGGGAANPNNMDGTYAGGGGNGINGTAIESYHQDISALPEFQMYIAPILERMAQSTPDVFVGYLNWAIHHKTWYLVPVALPNLPKDKTALAFPSDQLALHSESEIYIDQLAYEKKPRKERAYLLMHELVMGARLLMKHSAKFQCSALNSDQQAMSCDSEALLKLAVSPLGSDDEKPSLAGSDDEAVRSMTAFLMTRSQDYSGPAIRAYRLGLGFNYPWDRVVSNFTLDSLEDAFTRSDVSGDKLYFQHNGKDEDARYPKRQACAFQHYRLSNAFSGFFQLPDSARETIPGTYVSLTTEDRFAKSEGVLDPRGGTQVVDHIHITPNLDLASRPSRTYPGGPDSSFYSLDYYVTREAHPRLIRVEAQAVAVMASSTKSKSEIIPVRGKAPLVCIAED